MAKLPACFLKLLCLTYSGSIERVTQSENHNVTTASAIQKPSRFFCMVNVPILLLLLLSVLIYLILMLPAWGMPKNQSRNGPVPMTPPWALECWLW